MASKCMNGCPASLIIRTVPVKTTMRYHLSLIRMDTKKTKQTKSPESNKGWGEGREIGSLEHCLLGM